MSEQLCITTITTDFPCTIKQEFIIKQHEMITSQACLITLSGAARVIIIPIPQEDIKAQYVEIQRDDRTSFIYKQDTDSTSEDIKVQLNKDKAFLPTNDDDTINFLSSFEERDPKVNIILPVNSNQLPVENITISSIAGQDIVYKRDAHGIWNTTSIEVLKPYIIVSNLLGNKDKAYLPYLQEDRKAFIDAFSKTSLFEPFNLDSIAIPAETIITEVVIPLQCKGFILGRKAQFINDYYPIVPRDKGRSGKMSKLLPSLIANNEEIKKNLILCIQSSKKVPNLDSYYYPDIDKLNLVDQYKLGRDYQFLQDSNCVRTNLNLLTPDQITEEASSFRERLNSGFYNLRKNRDEFRKKLNRTNIVECRGDKCRISFEDGNNEHCESCYADLTIEDIARALHGKYHNNSYYGEYSELERIITES